MNNLENKIGNLWIKFKRCSLVLVICAAYTQLLPEVFPPSRGYAQNAENPAVYEKQIMQSEMYDENSPKLKVIVPGINTNGQQMFENAKKTLRYDPECTVIIEEAEGWTENNIKENIIKATRRAIEKNKDVIALVDMDLEHNVLTSSLTPKQIANLPLPLISTPWFKAVNWGGSMINNVSEIYDSVFEEKGTIRGKKECDSHSAGGDSFECSLRLSSRRLFDQVNIFNGRTTTSELIPELVADKYTPDKVNLFLTKGDLIANPHSISNIDAVIPYASKIFTVYYCDEMPSINPISNHSSLVNEPHTLRSFCVYDGQKPYQIRTSVENLKREKSASELSPIISREIAPIQTNLENRLGGILFDKDNAYLVDADGTLKEIEKSMLQNRMKKEEISWRFEHEDQEYQAIALPFGKNQKEIRYYHNPDQKVIVIYEGNALIVCRYIKNNDLFQIIQLAKGILIGEKDNFPIFKIDQTIMIDYPLDGH